MLSRPCDACAIDCGRKGTGMKTESGGTKKHTGGRPAHVPTEETRALVKTWAQVGTTQPVISRELGISEDTLQKHYRDELDEASSRGVANVASNLYSKAMAGDTTAMIFYLKTRGRWSEKPALGDSDNPLVVQTDALDRALELAKQAARAKTPGV